MIRTAISTWSISAGDLNGLQIRLSWLLPFVALWIISSFGWVLGLAVFALLCGSLLLHELGHVLAARALGNAEDLIVLGPTGGLIYSAQPGRRRDDIFVCLAGPAVNLALCLIFLPAVLQANEFLACISPIQLATDFASLRKSPLITVQLLAFQVNWLLFVVNFIPAIPQDSGWFLRNWLVAEHGSVLGTEVTLRFSVLMGAAFVIIGLMIAPSPVFVFYGFCMLLACLLELRTGSSSDEHDDSFLGYDFSAGYTSLEQSDRPAERRVGFWEQWQISRRKKQQLKLQEAERRLDELLAKVHSTGLQSLSRSERRMLHQVSELLRQKDRPPETQFPADRD